MSKEYKFGKQCCEVLDLVVLWFKTQDGDKILPHLIGTDGNKYRVNYCPSCGKNIRAIIIKKEDNE